MKSKVLAILFIDMVDSTKVSLQQSRKDDINQADTIDTLLTPSITEFNGIIIKKMGDGLMASFESPTNAVLAGVNIQKAVENFNLNSPKKYHFRIGINTGEVSVKDDDIFGTAVNIASRVESIAESDSVYFTEATHLCMRKSEIQWIEIGYRQLKGINSRIKLYKVANNESENHNETGSINDANKKFIVFRGASDNLTFLREKLSFWNPTVVKKSRRYQGYYFYIEDVLENDITKINNIFAENNISDIEGQVLTTLPI